MKLLALDPSLTRTGYAIFSAPPPTLADLEVGSFTSEDPEDFVRQVLAIVDDRGIEFIAAEMARGIVLMYGKKQLGGIGAVTPNGNQLKLSEIQGGMRGVCAARHIPLALVAPKTWRAKVLGNGNLSRPEAKAAAKRYCQQIKVEVKNHDVAEAVCIGLWAATCDQQFRMAVHEEERKSAS